MILVTGGLEFYGILPKITWTRLTSIALSGNNII